MIKLNFRQFVFLWYRIIKIKSSKCSISQNQENAPIVQAKISGVARAVKNGFTKGGNQRVFCNSCLKSRVLYRKFGQDFDVQSIRRSFLERMSLCGVCRVFLISYYQVYKELNLCFLLLPNFKTQVAKKQQIGDILEFDELCGFCQNKKNKQWIWAALSRNTRQIVAYVIGDRSEITFRRLIRKIPIEYLKSQSYSDYGGTPSQILCYFKSKRKPPTSW